MNHERVGRWLLLGAVLGAACSVEQYAFEPDASEQPPASGGASGLLPDAAADVASSGAAGSLQAAGGAAGEDAGTTLADAGTDDASTNLADSGSGDAAPDATVDCRATRPDCPCIEGRCADGLGCLEGTCVRMPQPIAHWRFDGNANDSVGLYHGEPRHGVTFPSTTADFDGEDSFVDISVFSPRFKSIWHRFSLTLRIRARSLDGDPILFGLSDVGESTETNAFWFMVEGGKAALVTETGAGANHSTPLGEVLPTESWLDLVFVISQDRVRFWLNGQFVTAQDFVRPDSTATKMQIGGWIQPENPFDGEIDDVRVYDVELTEPEVAALASTY